MMRKETKMIDQAKMADAVRSVTVGVQSSVIRDVNYQPWEFERPVTAPQMDAGAAMNVRISDSIQRIVRSERNCAGEWTYDTMFELNKAVTKWMALYKYRTEERFASKDAAHPDEKSEKTAADDPLAGVM